MTLHEALQSLAVLCVVALAWRVGTARALHGSLIPVAYLAVSAFAWRLGGMETLAVLALAHMTGAAVCVGFSTTMGGIVAGWIFIALMGLDVAAFTGLVALDRAQGAFWAGAYADWKGVLSYALIIAIGFGVSGRNRFQPFLAFRSAGSRDHGNHGWPLAVENDAETSRSGSG